MAVNYNNTPIVTDGLVFYLDAVNSKCYDNEQNLIINSSSIDGWAVGSFTLETTNVILGLNTVRVTNLTSDGDSPQLTARSNSPAGYYTVSHFIDTTNSTCTSVTIHIFGATVNGNSYATANFNLSTKQFNEVTYSGTSWTNGSTQVIDYGNGIYRICLTAQVLLQITTFRAYVIPSPAETSYALIAGSQIVAGTKITPYIPTSGTAIAGGATITDLSGTGNNGTLENGVIYVNSSYGGQFNFDGINDAIVIPHSSSLNLDTEVTQEVWCYVNSYTSRGTLATKNESYYLQINTNTLVEVYTYYDDNGQRGTSTYNQSTQSIQLNTWYQIVFTENSLGVRKIYINGNLDSTHQAEPSIYKTSANLEIGSQVNSRWFNGLISNVKVYNRALTASEVQQNFNATRRRYGI